MHFYRPADGHRLPHDPFKSIIAPRPIGWIGTRSPAGVDNLAPYSFFNGFSDRPPLIGFCSMGRKDSLDNAEATGVFTWNLATHALREAMNGSSEGVPNDTDEFALTGLDKCEGVAVAAPRVAASPVHFECRTTQVIELCDASGQPRNRWLLIGEVVAVHIEEHLLVDGIYQTAAAEPILRGGGPLDYFSVTEDRRFQMERPANAGYEPPD